MVVGTPEFHEGVKRCIPSEFNMISAADDSQEAQEAYSTAKFNQLPNPNGKEGGACTSAFLQVCYENAYKMGKLTWVQVLKQMRGELKKMGFDQEPQLTSSRIIDVNKPMYLVPPGSGKRRALLIGINYVGQGAGELRAPQNDTNNLYDYLTNVCGFDPKECLVLMDDGNHPEPTRKNIEDAFDRIVRYSQPNDVVFISFSGHGGQIEDTDGDEDDGMDESIIPSDFATNGQIIDDYILAHLIKPMVEGVHVTLLMDCCHSGTVADLPYKFGADDTEPEIEAGFNMETYEELIAKQHQEKKDKLKADQNPPPVKDYHPEPLPYNPEHGFIVRPAARGGDTGDNDPEVVNNHDDEQATADDAGAAAKGKKGKPDKNKKKKKNKDGAKTPPPQCCVM